MKENEQMYLEVIRAYQKIMLINLYMIIDITKNMREGFTEEAIRAILCNAADEVKVVHTSITPTVRALKLSEQ